MAALAIVKPHQATHTKTETMEITLAVLANWLSPPFQRPLRVNDKVRAISGQIKDDGVIPGVMTLGVLEKRVYLIDGQHRGEAFKLAAQGPGAIDSAFADVRTHYFETMAEMGSEFVRINSSITPLKPDDILRGLEGSLPVLLHISKKCPFVGYDQIRRGGSAPILSMSMTLRCWNMSLGEVPGSSSAMGSSAAQKAQQMTIDEAERCADFLTMALEAWGRDQDYRRIWSSLNMTICMWLYRRLVLTRQVGRVTRVDSRLFAKLLMSLTANTSYMDWLVGRSLGERDRSPCFQRVKALFVKRIFEETGQKGVLPSPAWSAHSSGSHK